MSSITATIKTAVQTLIWILFIVTTFITQMTQVAFINLLIAIMDDTFDRVTEDKDNYERQIELDGRADLV